MSSNYSEYVLYVPLVRFTLIIIDFSMRFPQSPPKLEDLIAEVAPERLLQLARHAQTGTGRYLHWDQLRHRPPPEGLSLREWWLSLKMARANALQPIGLKDKEGRSFKFAVPEEVLQELHQIDLSTGGLVSAPEPIINPQTRDRYLVRSLMEEAITSSQLEGAATTREVAKDMIRTGRRPHDASEQMILNNYLTMQRIRDLKSAALSPELVLEIHHLITAETLAEPTAAGRFRRPAEPCVVGDDAGQIFHDPPPADELAERLNAMCAFANGETPARFMHPAVRAVILHFWLAYDHPFVDGNGRTARALFYWSMLRSGYWLFEFISISTILRKAPVQYGRSFLYTETDDNDLTYFLVAQTAVIAQAIDELHRYIERKAAQLRQAAQDIRALALFNHRQVALIRHALSNPGQRYTIASHQQSHAVAYQTARTDLLDLAERGVLEMGKRGRAMIFVAPADAAERLAALAKHS